MLEVILAISVVMFNCVFISNREVTVYVRMFKFPTFLFQNFLSRVILSHNTYPALSTQSPDPSWADKHVFPFVCCVESLHAKGT